MKKLARDVKHYLPLVSIIFVSFLGLAIFSYDKAFQIVIVVAASAGYVAWGLVHHYLHKDLHLSVFFEYLIIAALGVTIVISVLLSS